MPPAMDVIDLEKEYGSDSYLYLRKEGLKKSQIDRTLPPKKSFYVSAFIVLILLITLPSVSIENVMRCELIPYSWYGDVLVCDDSNEVFVIGDYGDIVRLGNDGKIIWYFDLGDDFYWIDDYISYNGSLYVCSYDDSITVINSDGLYETTIDISNIIESPDGGCHLYKLIKSKYGIFISHKYGLYQIYPNYRSYNFSLDGYYIFSGSASDDIISLLFRNYTSENLFKIIYFNVTSWSIEGIQMLKSDIDDIALNGKMLYVIDYLSVKAYEIGRLVWEVNFAETPIKIEPYENKLYVTGKFQNKIYLYELSLNGEIIRGKEIFENDIVKKSFYKVESYVFINKNSKITYIFLGFYSNDYRFRDKYIMINLDENFNVLSDNEIDTKFRISGIYYSEFFNDFYVRSNYRVYLLKQTTECNIDLFMNLPLKILLISVAMVAFYGWWVKWRRKG